MASIKTKEGRIANFYKNHPFWLSLAILSTLFSLIVAANATFILGSSYIRSTFLWKQVEQRKIDQLAPMQTLNFFNSLLGEPNLKLVKDDTLTRYTYKERGYWVEAFVDKNNTVQIMDITACGDEGFYPIIKNNPIGQPIVLSKTKMKYAQTPKGKEFTSTGYPEIKLHYFLRGATAPSYFYDEYYEGNPSSYQAVLTGNNDLCGYVVLPDDIAKELAEHKNNTLNDEQVNRLRANMVINTFTVTSPSVDLSLKGFKLSELAEGGVGVSYIDEAVLSPSTGDTEKKHKSINDAFDKAKDFDVIKY